MNLLLTGRPGIGKTTVIKRVLEVLKVPATGFYTREIRGPQGRLGFEAITLDGRRCTLAHVNFKSPYRVSKYGVDVSTFEEIVVPSIDPDLHPHAALIVIDEIGKMECFSDRFCKTVIRALDSNKPVLGTITLGGNAFIEGIKRRSDVELILVTLENRDRLPAVIMGKLRL
ncbi:MAG: NTPase [Anaerolineae bacterium]|nr:NTPase [Anaerolineae bacterium]MDW8103320.1 NTPase [Anaerolineae bacterium]